jgi:hypothetical protein
MSVVIPPSIKRVVKISIRFRNYSRKKIVSKPGESIPWNLEVRFLKNGARNSTVGLG